MVDVDYKDDFPNVLVHRRVDYIKNHSEFNLAKNGDPDAAVALVNDLVDMDKVKILKDSFRDAIIVPVQGIDSDEMNYIPVAYANVLSDLTGFELEESIIQTNDVSRTNKNGLERLLFRAQFEGDVKAGRNYIIVDDVVTQGGTLSELRSFIESNGGKVVMATTLGYTQYSAALAIKKETINEIERKHGRYETEQFLREFKISNRIEQLTNSEGKYILSYKGLNRIRERAIEIKSNGLQQEDQKGYRRQEDNGKVMERESSYTTAKSIKNVIIDSYKDEEPLIKHISEKSALIIDNLNREEGKVLTIKDIKGKYKEIGKKLEEGNDKELFKTFKELGEIINDLKHARLIDAKETSNSKVVVKIKTIEITI